jgi:hypothetical protein
MTVVAEAEIRGHWAGRRDHAGVDRADRSETRALNGRNHRDRADFTGDRTAADLISLGHPASEAAGRSPCGRISSELSPAPSARCNAGYNHRQGPRRTC